MNDKQLLEDILTSIKGMCDLYMHGTIESSTINVHNTFNNSLFDNLQMQNTIFKKMQEKGWYQTECAPQTKIAQARQKIMNQQ